MTTFGDDSFGLRQLYEQVNGGPGTSVVQPVAAALGSLAAEFTGSSVRINVALRGTGVSWQGRAAEAAGEGLARMAEWADTGGQDAKTGGGHVQDYSDSFARLKAAVAEPRSVPLMTAGQAVWGVMSDHETALRHNQEAAQAALQALADHEEATERAIRAFPDTATPVGPAGSTPAGPAAGGPGGSSAPGSGHPSVGHPSVGHPGSGGAPVMPTGGPAAGQPGDQPGGGAAGSHPGTAPDATRSAGADSTPTVPPPTPAGPGPGSTTGPTTGPTPLLTPLPGPTTYGIPGAPPPIGRGPLGLPGAAAGPGAERGPSGAGSPRSDLPPRGEPVARGAGSPVAEPHPAGRTGGHPSGGPMTGVPGAGTGSGRQHRNQHFMPDDEPFVVRFDDVAPPVLGVSRAEP